MPAPAARHRFAGPVLHSSGPLNLFECFRGTNTGHLPIRIASGPNRNLSPCAPELRFRTEARSIATLRPRIACLRDTWYQPVNISNYSWNSAASTGPFGQQSRSYPSQHHPGPRPPQDHSRGFLGQLTQIRRLVLQLGELTPPASMRTWATPLRDAGSTVHALRCVAEPPPWQSALAPGSPVINVAPGQTFYRVWGGMPR